MVCEIPGKEIKYGKQYEEQAPDAGSVSKITFTGGKIIFYNVGFFIEKPFFYGVIQGAAGDAYGNYRDAGNDKEKI